jgi:hypothetical protein
MAITATLVFAARNRMQYLVAATAGGGEAVSISAATLFADAIAGPLKNIAGASTNGYGIIAAGTILTQAQGRALWLSDNAIGAVSTGGPGSPGVPTAVCRLRNRTTATSNFFVDAGTLGALVVTANGIGTCYLDINVPGAIGA